ncbi:MAG: VPLPA-CTERM sorting domain-containing protein [Thermodesulfobacteriota bacterium]|nr:VPLPA-CTERM sorting domain-containing protein [Thermodesulfobacteriota bacterium]
MKRAVIVFSMLTALLVFPVAGQADEFDPGDFTFEGDFIFDINSTYTINGVSLPLNVQGLLDVYHEGDEIGDLALYGYKTDTDEDTWDGTYAGNWVFDPPGCLPCDHEIGLFDDLSLFGDYLEVSFSGLNEELGLSGDELMVAGAYDFGVFEGDVAVPIPASVLLLGTGLVSLLGFQRRKLA